MPENEDSWLGLQLRRVRRVARLVPDCTWPPSRIPTVACEFAHQLRIHLFQAMRGFVLAVEAEHRGRREPGPHSRGYVITAPDYVSNSIGIRCLYRLCDELNRRGYPSHIVGSTRTAPDLHAPLIGQRMARSLCKRNYTAVYPERVTGNPLRARHVARWVLNRPGLLGGEAVYDEAELVFSYSNVYTPSIKNPIAGKLYMPMIDQHLFYPGDIDDSHRALECFYIGKSSWKDGIVDRARAFEITRSTPKRTELGKLFRAARVLYTFDNSTMLIYEALACGCPVVVIPDGTQTKAEYQQLELGMDGIAWGIEEREQAQANVGKLLARYKQAERDFVVQFDQFIAITQRASAEEAGTTSEAIPLRKAA